MVFDDFFFAGDEEHLLVTTAILVCTKNGEVEIHLVHGIRDVLLSLKPDLALDRILMHSCWKRDYFHDDAAGRKSRRHGFVTASRTLQESLQRTSDVVSRTNRTRTYFCFRAGFDIGPGHGKLAAPAGKFDHPHRFRTDIQTD